MDYFSSICNSVRNKDGDSMAELIVNKAPESCDVQLLEMDHIQFVIKIPKELKPVLEQVLMLKKLEASHGSEMNLFNETGDLLRALNRFAENKDNWAVKPLIAVTKLLISRAVEADNYMLNNPNEFNAKAVGDFEVERCLTKAARIIHNSFKLCLNDRNEDDQLTRRKYTYFFVAHELKIYYKLQNRDLAKNMEKVLVSLKRNLPDLMNIEKSHAVTYLYYSGIIFCGDGDFITAYKKFKLAYQLCNKKDDKHAEAILLYLIPLKFVVTRQYPDFAKFAKRLSVYSIYKALFESVVSGDLSKFDKEFDELEIFFLKKNLYFAIETMRQYVILKLIKRIHLITGSPLHLSIRALTAGFEVSLYHNDTRNVTNFSSDETECLMANLIYEGHIKGYLSHSNGVCVLSKKDPFPKQVRADL
ncbi:unnamed protein product [Cyberlindnera jadinii]|uniref:PCI domain-containing protein n=2 Tax=Cyberlindnera jadinii (strain ATCC 18201 / CBS 1600 / BCRC 20928 / JCM 3617 / NBRC 0987 / NRRL Y-1542) TaxID=983966 RepID=A0A0H5C917_CYBJN|nr:unnamed protein product [Cyberlindnera jadinii]